METTKKKKLICFGILMFIGMFVSVVLKNENIYDFANYHYYNAFALLNNRTQWDLVPACVNTFFNPIIELPLYFYIKYFNDYPNILYALQGIWFGLFLVALCQICTLVFEQDKKGVGYTVLTLALATIAQATLRQIGASTNEVSVAVFILYAFYLLMKMVKFTDTQRWQGFLIAGLLMGIGLGLKQNSISCCVAAGLTLMICLKYLNKPIQSIFFFALGGLIGYLIINGYFMYKYWVLYGNPFFPFLNKIFKSPYFFDFNYRDARFVPSWKLYLIYPLIWNKKILIMERPYYDHHLSLLYVLFICGFVWLATRRKLKNLYQTERLFVMLAVFGFLSFMIWMALFCILRYMVAIDAIASVFLVKLLDLYGKKSHKVMFVLQSMLIAGLFVGVHFYPEREVSFGRHLDVPEIELPENTLVKIYGMESSFLIPALNKNQTVKTTTHYKTCVYYEKMQKNMESVAPMNIWFKIALKSFFYSPSNCFFDKGSDFAEFGAFAKKREKVEKEHTGPIIYLYDNTVYVTEADAKKQYEKRKRACMMSEKANTEGYMENCMRTAEVIYSKHMTDAVKEMPKDYQCAKFANNMWVDFRICVPPELEYVIQNLKQNDEEEY